MVIKPFLYPCDGWCRPLPTRGEAVIGVEISDIGFDDIKFADQPYTLLGYRRRTSAGDLN